MFCKLHRLTLLKNDQVPDWHCALGQKSGKTAKSQKPRMTMSRPGVSYIERAFLLLCTNFWGQGNLVYMYHSSRWDYMKENLRVFCDGTVVCDGTVELRGPASCLMLARSPGSAKFVCKRTVPSCHVTARVRVWRRNVFSRRTLMHSKTVCVVPWWTSFSVRLIHALIWVLFIAGQAKS